MSTSAESEGPPPLLRDPDHTQPLPPVRAQGDALPPSRDEGGETASTERSYADSREPRYPDEPGYPDDDRYADKPRYADGPRYPRESEYPEKRSYTTGSERTALPREEDFYGGVKVGSAFYGWLTAAAMTVLVSTVLSGIGASVAVATDTSMNQLSASADSDPRSAAIVAGIAVLLVVLIAYYCGGYVAGRMARFDGVRQGVAVWCWGVLMTLLLWLVVFLVGDRWDPGAVIQGLPTFDMPMSPTSSTGLVALGATALVALLGSIIGSVVGVRYHRRIDEAMMGS